MAPANGWSTATDRSPEARKAGRGSVSSASQAQVLRNQAVGSTWTVSASGPLFVSWMAISRSSGPALA